jgi:ParB-like chromosome segregation protein Spo0J
VGEDGGLIAGHARILAARQLGIAEIPVMVAAVRWLQVSCTTSVAR